MSMKSLMQVKRTEQSVGRRRLRLVVAGLVLLAGILVVLPAGVSALTTLSQGYFAKNTVMAGAIVSLEKDSTDQIVASNTGNVNDMLGVVINDGSSLLSLSNSQAAQVQIATSGVVQVLVSDINGSVVRGDQITASPINGVGMKATGNAKVIGTAQEDLTTSNGSVQTYTDKDGKQQTVNIGEIAVHVNVAYYFKQPDKTIIPTAIQNVANALAGKTVTPLPIIISMGIFIISLGTVMSIIYSMIHSSIISVGRNPMSQSAIYRNLIQLSTLVAAILAATIISIYMVLTRF